MTTWTFDGKEVTAREFHRALRAGAGLGLAPMEVRCVWCRHLLWYRVARWQAGLPFLLWRLRMGWVTARIQLVRRFAPSCRQCRFNREVRGW